MGRNNYEMQDTSKKGAVIAAVLLCLIIVACSGILYKKIKGDTNKSDSLIKTTASASMTALPIETAAATAVPVPTQDITGKAKSRLTGQYIDAKIVNNRPYAVMFNNIKVASPQSGTSECDILFEAVVEGGITRMMGIAQQFTCDRIGSLRSARPYYVDFVKDFDAIYIHMGGSDDAKAKIKKLEVADMDGITGIGNTLMYRDKSIKAPHNAFTSAKKIAASVKSKKFRMNYEGVKNNHFLFNETATDLVSKTNAIKVSIKFSSYTTPYFEYNASTKTYGRYQFKTKHIDYNTKKQLAFTNIIIMYVKQWSLDSKDRQAMDIANSTGAGYYISGGKAVNIKWSRDGSKQKMLFLDSAGKQLMVNPGKTYIAVVPNTLKSSTSIK